MDDQATDNQTMTEGTPETNGAETTANTNIADIMGNMAGENTPDSKPAAAGDNEEGQKKPEETKTDFPAWTQQLPEEMRNDAELMKQLGKFQKIGDIAKSYSELESKLGKSLIQPGENASDEEVQAFYERLGKPKSADGYSIKGDEAKFFREIAFKNNLSDAQAKSFFEQLQGVGNAAINQQKIALQQQATETENKLKAEYGNSYNTKIEMLRRGVETYGGKELGNLLKNSGLLANETVVRMFIKLGEQSAEAHTQNNGSQSKGSYKSTDEGGTFTFINKMNQK